MNESQSKELFSKEITNMSFFNNEKQWQLTYTFRFQLIQIRNLKIIQNRKNILLEIK